MYFPDVKTNTLDIQLQEITLGDALAVSEIPTHLEQAAISAFLRAAIAGGCRDVLDLTVQQRMLIFGQYLSVLNSQGDAPAPDFIMTGDMRYSDFWDWESDPDCLAADYPVGQLNGENWRIRHLTGRGAEMIERLTEVSPLRERKGAHWLIGAMAYQMFKESDPPPENQTDDWLWERIKQFVQVLPESDVSALYVMREKADQDLHHYFAYTFHREGGIIILSKDQGDGKKISAARFLAGTALSRFSNDMAERYSRTDQQHNAERQHVATGSA